MNTDLTFKGKTFEFEFKNKLAGRKTLTWAWGKSLGQNTL